MYVCTNIRRIKIHIMEEPLHFQVWTTDFYTFLHSDIHFKFQYLNSH